MVNIANYCTFSYGACTGFYEYIYFALMYMTDLISPVIPIKYLIDQDGEPTTPQKLGTGMTPSVSNLSVLFCTCVV